MAHWKLINTNADNFYELCLGEIAIGRGIENNICLSSTVVSRKHCILLVGNVEILIKDLKSSNGTYVRDKRIPTNTYVRVEENDLIALGWTDGIAPIRDDEKCVFKLINVNKEIKLENQLASMFQETNEPSIHTQNGQLSIDMCNSPISKPNGNILNIKDVKIEITSDNSDEDRSDQEIKCRKRKTQYSDVIDLCDSDSNLDSNKNLIKRFKMEEPAVEINLTYEEFNIKQEYIEYNEEAIQIDSDTDSESEMWLSRLSQNSLMRDEVDYPLQSSDEKEKSLNFSNTEMENKSLYTEENENLYKHREDTKEDKERKENGIVIQIEKEKKEVYVEKEKQEEKKDKEKEKKEGTKEKKQESKGKKNESKKGKNESKERKNESKERKNESKERKNELKERKNELKERKNESKERKNESKERKTESKEKINTEKRMKDKTIDSKEKEKAEKKDKYKETKERSKSEKKSNETKEKDKERNNKLKHKEVNERKENKVEGYEKKEMEFEKNSTGKEKTERGSKEKQKFSELMNKEKCNVTITLKKTKKCVRFIEKAEIRYYEIEEEHKLKPINLVKSSLIDIRQKPFTAERRYLMKMLRWNPHWLEEQMKIDGPPPILGHDNPMALLHFFDSHEQYVRNVGELLLMEVWECVSQAYFRSKDDKHIELRVESIPNSPDSMLAMFTISVNATFLKTEFKNVPRVGEIMIITSSKQQNSKFFYVHNVRCLPSPQNNIHNFYSISLQGTSNKMKSLHPGEIVHGKRLSYIKNELMLFEAMEYLSCSPLFGVILKPKPQAFPNLSSYNYRLQSQWTDSLNPSQMEAVTKSINAASSSYPSLQMVQGPPGTGKSAVICATVMTYFYDPNGKKKQDLGKILICATSNAAVDELVLRLLKIRQTLPHGERFRMVRVGRNEAMHPRARDVSSETLALRDQQRVHLENGDPSISAEISYLMAKFNMWNTSANDSSDAGRKVYCQTRATEFKQRLDQLQSGGTPTVRVDQLLATEQRIIDCADIVVTTLSSAANHKMKSLKGRISLCIVDEAGQALEPEILIPLTLDVTHITLIGDPQQLPGFICSQRAKKYGLGESMFARLLSCTSDWKTNPTVLLNIQYRMHPAIADYPNRTFYNGLIKNGTKSRDDLPIPSYLLVGIDNKDRGGQDVMGANEMEAWGVAHLAIALLKQLKPFNLNIAIITPYNGQKETIKKCMKILQQPEAVEVSTVDSFQGQERDVVLVSLARSAGAGFLSDAGRLNVMLTRARHALLLCLNPSALMVNSQWRTLIEDGKRRKLIRNLPNHVCQANNRDDILKYVRKNIND